MQLVLRHSANNDKYINDENHYDENLDPKDLLAVARTPLNRTRLPAEADRLSRPGALRTGDSRACRCVDTADFFATDGPALKGMAVVRGILEKVDGVHLPADTGPEIWPGLLSALLEIREAPKTEEERRKYTVEEMRELVHRSRSFALPSSQRRADPGRDFFSS